MLRKLVYAGAILLLITNDAAAQSGLGAPESNQSNLSLPPFKRETPPTQEETDRRKALDKAYDAAVQKIPDKKSSTDPWGGVRPTSSATTRTSNNKRRAGVVTSA